MALLSLAGVHTVWAILLPQYLFAIGHGVHQPCGQAGAVGPFPEKAGTAASLSGFTMTLAALGVGVWLGLHARRLGLSADPRHRRPQRRPRHGRLDAGAAPWRAGPGGAPARRDASSVSRAPAGSALACLCIAGPTASGKSRAAMALAEQLAPRRQVEIVSVDSALVYRGMDIGTAKPSAGRARRGAASPDRHPRSGRALFGRALRRRRARA